MQILLIYWGLSDFWVWAEQAAASLSFPRKHNVLCMCGVSRTQRLVDSCGFAFVICLSHIDLTGQSVPHSLYLLQPPSDLIWCVCRIFGFVLVIGLKKCAEALIFIYCGATIKSPNPCSVFPSANCNAENQIFWSLWFSVSLRGFFKISLFWNVCPVQWQKDYFCNLKAWKFT